MFRIDTLTKVLDLFGLGKPGFRDGNRALAVPATDFSAAWCNDVQEEICNVIEAAGIVLDANNRSQLLQAIQQFVVGAQKAVVISNATLEASVADGEVVRWDSANNRFDEAIADGTANNRAVGIADVANAKVYLYGECPLFAGLTPGARYYLDAATPGAITAVVPVDGIVIGIAKSATVLFVDPDALGLRADVANIFTAGQGGTVGNLPATTGTLNFDFTAASNFSGQVTGDIVMGNGYTTHGAGKATWFSIRVQQSAGTLRNWSFASNWKYVGGSAAIPPQTQVASAWDEIIGQVLTDGTISFAVRSNVS
jgi:hypothetical protein